MKSCFLLGMLLLGATLAQAQVLTIRDNVTGRPLADVSVYSGQTKTYARSDIRGQVDLSAFRDADSIRFDLVGYRAAVHSYEALVAEALTL
ncbi:MAG: hypothetical protein WC824_13150, partial [Bacteroidota bacterium]